MNQLFELATFTFGFMVAIRNISESVVALQRKPEEPDVPPQPAIDIEAQVARFAAEETCR